MKYVVTAADEKFNPIIGFWRERVRTCGLTPIIFDLGGLTSRFSSFKNTYKFEATVPKFDQFRENGYYQTLADGAYKSKAIHKPAVISEAMKVISKGGKEESFLYLDADAFLRGVPTSMEGQWDICVTLRPTSEQKKISDEKRAFIGLINAGVIWFNNTSAATEFMYEWYDRTYQEMNDQRALNLICQEAEIGKVKVISLKNGKKVRLMAVPTILYNNYYKEGVDKALVVHLKDNEWKGMTIEQLKARCELVVKPTSQWTWASGGGKHYHKTNNTYVHQDRGWSTLDYYLAYQVISGLLHHDTQYTQSTVQKAPSVKPNTDPIQNDAPPAVIPGLIPGADILSDTINIPEVDPTPKEVETPQDQSITNPTPVSTNGS